jgi:glycosyltransferase involved in cell wall biosynthesis
VNQPPDAPKVSVCVITYNQAKYIGQCLQSLVEQKTNFEFEVIVGDDRSTDETPRIVHDFAKRYPQIIRPILHTSHVGGTKNNLAVHSLARGEYVAHVDGDDVAFPGKLQRQASFLDDNHECVVVWHRLETFNDAGTIRYVGLARLEEVIDTAHITQSDFLRYGTLGYPSSMMYRRANGPDFSAWIGDVLDFSMSVELLRSGYAVNLNEVLGGYRHNVNVASLSKTQQRRAPGSILFAKHLRTMLDAMPSERGNIFVNATTHLLADVKHRRPTALLFLELVIRSFTPRELVGLPAHVRGMMKLRTVPPTSSSGSSHR